MKTVAAAVAIVAMAAVAAGCGGSGSGASSASCSDTSYQADSPLYLPLQFALTNLNSDAQDESALLQDARQIKGSGAKILAALRLDMPCSDNLKRNRRLHMSAVAHWVSAARIIENGCRAGDQPCGTNLVNELQAGKSAWDQARQ